MAATKSAPRSNVTHLVQDGGVTLFVDEDTGTIIDQDGEGDEEALASQHYKALARIPDADQFAESPYLPSPELEELAETLIERHVMAAQYFSIAVLWKKKGGMSKGRPVWGTTEILRDKAKYFAGETDIVITVSANHAYNLKITNYILEAILHHELLHIDAATDDNGVQTPLMREHDMDGFSKDVTVYGNWLPIHRSMKAAFEQARLIPDDYLV